MKDLTVGKVGKLIMQFAMPMVFGNMFQQLYNVVDSIIIGYYIGKEALAAVGASFPITFLVIAMVIGLSTGFTIIISQYFGSKNIEQVKTTIDTTYVILFFASIIISVVGILFSEPVFRFTQLPEDVIPQASDYIDIYFAGTIFFFGFNGTASILRGMGDSKTPFYFLILSSLSNILLDLLFVVRFGCGIEGAAWATVLSQGIAFFSGVIYLNIRHPIVNVSIRKYVFDRDIFRSCLRIGLPSGLQQSVVAAGLIALFGIVNQFGTDTIAAYSVAIRIDSFASLMAMNLAAALAAFVGQNIGAEKPERVKAGLKFTLLITSAVSICLTILVYFFGPDLMALFTPDKVVIELGNEYLVIVSSFYIVLSTLFVVNAVMYGAGDTLAPMFITFVALWGVRVPASYFLAERIGSVGIWWAVPLGWGMGMILAYLYYLSEKWKGKSVVKHEGSVE